MTVASHHGRRDVALLHTVARLADRFWREGRRLRPREVVAEYEKTILDELEQPAMTGMDLLGLRLSREMPTEQLEARIESEHPPRRHQVGVIPRQKQGGDAVGIEKAALVDQRLEVG